MGVTRRANQKPNRLHLNLKEVEAQPTGHKSKKRSRRWLRPLSRTRDNPNQIKSFQEAGAADRPQAKFNTQKLKDQATKDIFIASIKDKAETQINTSEEVGVEKHWNNLKTVWSQTCIEILGRKKRQDKQWLTTDTWKLIEERRTVKQKIIQCTDEQQKQELNASYNTLNKRVKKVPGKTKENIMKPWQTKQNKLQAKETSPHSTKQLGTFRANVRHRLSQ
uniref:Uncharacterized protein n=1 Tax=Trichobilharzia regenti TaxID=157069 RepID=A0AA85ISP9_TRIRE|nr:unnamed protein product [Trichobilharzia regenti]